MVTSDAPRASLGGLRDDSRPHPTQIRPGSCAFRVRNRAGQARLSIGSENGMDGPLAAGVIAVVLKGYPRLSETFIAQELHALEERGLPLALYSLRHPTDLGSPSHSQRDQAPVVLHARIPVPRASARRPQSGCELVACPDTGDAVATWWRDLRRDFTASRIRRLGQAFVLAAEMPDNVVALHAHFLHTPASVARYAALLRALPWSCSAHAKDIWTTPEWEKREKLEACAWMTVHRSQCAASSRSGATRTDR